MLYVNVEELTDFDDIFYSLISETDCFNKPKINLKKLSNFLKENKTYKINKIFKEKNRFNSIYGINPLGKILEDTTYNFESESEKLLFKEILNELTLRIDNKLFHIEENDYKKEGILSMRNNSPFYALSNIILKNCKQSLEENTEHVNFFIEAFKTIFNTNERKNTIVFDSFIKNNFLYLLDDKYKPVARTKGMFRVDDKYKKVNNFLNIINTISSTQELRQELLHKSYSNMFDQFFNHNPVYPNPIGKVDKDKFMNFIKKDKSFNWKLLPSFNDKHPTFIGALYFQGGEYFVEKFLSTHATDKEIKTEMNNLIFQNVRQLIFFQDNSKNKDKELNSIIEFIQKDFDINLFSQVFGKSMLSMIKEEYQKKNGDAKVYNSFRLFYEKFEIILEKQELDNIIVEIKESKPKQRL